MKEELSPARLAMRPRGFPGDQSEAEFGSLLCLLPRAATKQPGLPKPLPGPPPPPSFRPCVSQSGEGGNLHPNLSGVGVPGARDRTVGPLSKHTGDKAPRWPRLLQMHVSLSPGSIRVCGAGCAVSETGGLICKCA